MQRPLKPLSNQCGVTRDARYTAFCILDIVSVLFYICSIYTHTQRVYPLLFLRFLHLVFSLPLRLSKEMNAADINFYIR